MGQVLREAAAEGLELVCSKNQAGYAGVTVMRGGQFAAQISAPGEAGRTIWLGTHPTAEEAALVVRAVRPNRNPNPHPDPSPDPNLNRNPGPDPGPTLVRWRVTARHMA